jgi:regulator of replication initiation timing
MERPKTSQFVINEFAKIIDSQDEKGYEKYGKSIDEAIDADYNWELMALEETADLQKYLVRRIAELKKENHFLNLDNQYLSERLKKAGQEIESYIDDLEQMEGMLSQANQEIKEMKKNSRLTRFYEMAEENLKLAEENARLKESQF